jgi:hypothetical protein
VGDLQWAVEVAEPSRSDRLVPRGGGGWRWRRWRTPEVMGGGCDGEVVYNFV